MSQGGILQGLQALQHNSLVNQQLKATTAENAGKQDARATLLGGAMSNGEKTNPLAKPEDFNGVSTISNALFGDNKPKPISGQTVEGLMGAGVNENEAKGLLNTVPSQQEYGARSTQLLDQAQPEIALQRMQMAPALKNMTPEQRSAFAIDPGKAADAYTRTVFPATPDKLRLVEGLKAKIDQFGPGTPAAKPYEDTLAAENIAVANSAEAGRHNTVSEAETASHNRATEAEGKYELKLDPFGNQSVFDKSTGKIITDPAAAESAVPALVDAQAKMIAGYKKRPITGIGSTRGIGAMIMAKVGSLNPDYDETQFDAKDKARKDFATGKQGESVKSGNVALSHVLLLEQLGSALDNGDVALANQIKNKLSDEFGGVPIASYEAVAPMVGDEVAKYVMGGQTAVTDRQEFAKPLTSARGTKARTGALNGFKSAMVGRLRGNKKQYEFNTKLEDFNDMLFPEVASLMSNPQYQEGVNPNQPQADKNAPLPPGMVKQVGTLKGKPVYEDAQGNRHMDMGG